MNKYEKKIKEMHDNLPPVGKCWTDMLINNISVHGFYSKGVVKCMGCGHTFEHEKIKRSDVVYGVCPHCHRKISITASKKQYDDSYTYGTVVQNFNDEFVVFRLFCIYYYTRFDNNMNLDSTWCHIFEARQVWYDIANDKKTYLSTHLMSYPNQVRNPYREGTDMIIRSSNKMGYYFGSYDISITSSEVAVIESLPKQISYLKIDDTVSDVSYIEDVLPASIKFPLFEAMFKKREYSIIETLSKADFMGSDNSELNAQRAVALKIALRHGYIEKIGCERIVLWMDYVNELIDLGNDIHNPFYVCPENLEAAHTVTSRKVTKLKAEIQKRKMYENAKKQASNFIERMGKFFPFSVSDGTITIEPLKSIEDFIEEAAYMNNCLVSNSYYNGNLHPNSLVLSARLNGWAGGLIVEDIEINMKTWKVVQCHGRFNKNSEYHDQILNLINSNIEKIKKLSLKKKDEDKVVQMHQEAV